MEVVVTGLGAIAGSAADAATLFERLSQGESMVREHPVYKAYGFACSALCTVDERTWAGVVAGLGPQAAGWGRATQMGLHAARQALRASGVRPGPEARAGVFVGCNKITFDERQIARLNGFYDAKLERLDFDAFAARGGHEPSEFHRKHQDTTTLALAAETGWQDVVSTHGDACAAGGIAIGAAYRRIQAGELDVALAGATEDMANFVPLASFNAVGALTVDTTRAAAARSRPFDRDRNGFVMSEGSAFVVLESAEHARRRGATPLARLRGFASRLEAHRITSSTEDGSEYARCIAAALDDAGLRPQDIDHVSAHGTSTPVNDSCEAWALKRVFGEHLARLPVTSNKSALGHSMACSGAVEAVLAVLSLQRGLLLPTLNFEQADEASAGLDIVTATRARPVRTVLSNSFGFGGQNCCLVLEKAEKA